MVIFDLDGTLLDTLEDLADAVNFALACGGYPGHTLEEIRGFVGNGIRNLVERAVPAGLSREQVEQVYGDFMDFYPRNCANKTAPYPGIPELLEELHRRGIPTAVNSNKADALSNFLCQRYFGDTVGYCLGAVEGMPRKPAPDGVRRILEHFGATEAIYVGDSEVDARTARNAGLKAILVTWGFRDKAFLQTQMEGLWLIDSVDELRNILY